MSETDIQRKLRSLAEPSYQRFQSKLLPTIAPDCILGVRTPALRSLAKKLRDSSQQADFLQQLPHRYYDENQLHALLLCEMRNYDSCLHEVCRFLPYVDNWATCDQLSPKVFQTHHRELLEPIQQWLAAPAPYTIRFGIGMLMRHFLDADFDPVYLETVAQIRYDDYYVRMMVAWYFATALSKQYDAALPYLTQCKLEPWTHNKAIQKCIESRRITPEHKDYLRTLRLRPCVK